MRDPKSTKALDGGWGWMVCLGSSFISSSLRALEPSFGLVFHDFLMNLGTDSTKTSFITSVFDANMNFSGLVVGVLLKKFSYRKVAFVGAMLSSIGLILTSMAQNVTHIICAYSVFTGIGTGFATAAAFVALNDYFDKKRGQAVGFSMVGTAIAMMLMPQLAHVLLEGYGFRGTVLLIGGWSMHSMLGACLLQPLDSLRTSKELLTLKVPMLSTRLGVIPAETAGSNGENNGSKKTSESEESLKNLINADKRPRKRFLSPKKPDFIEGTPIDKQNKQSGCYRLTVQYISNLLDLELLKNPVYFNVLIGLSLYNVAESNFKLMTPFFLRSVGMTQGEIAFCLSLTAFADIVARLALPVLYDKMGTSKRRLFWIASMLVGICRSILAEESKGTSLIVTLVVIGFIRGAAILNLSLSVSECCSLQQLPHAYGLFMVSKGIFSMTLSPLIGFVRDYSGSYSICIHAMTLLILISFISWSIEFSWEALHRRSKNRSNINDRIEKISIDCTKDPISMIKP